MRPREDVLSPKCRRSNAKGLRSPITWPKASGKGSSRATESTGTAWPRPGLCGDKDEPKCPKLGAKGAASKWAEEREDEEEAK